MRCATFSILRRRQQRIFNIFLLFLLALSPPSTSTFIVSKETLPKLPWDASFTWGHQDGHLVDLAVFSTKRKIVALAYSTCPSICHMTHKVLKELDKKFNQRVDILIFSVDPQTDTPQKRRQFLKKHDIEGKNWHFLSAKKSKTRSFVEKLGLRFSDKKGGRIMHSVDILLIDHKNTLLHKVEHLSPRWPQIFAAF